MREKMKLTEKLKSIILLLTEESIESLVDGIIVSLGLELDEARSILDHLADLVTGL